MTLSKIKRDEEAELLSHGLKRCRRCNEVKSLESFGRKKKNPGGIDHWCKVCNKAEHIKYRSNPEGHSRDIEYCKKWRAEHRRQVQEYNKQWNSQNSHVKQRLRRRWHLAHQEEENAKARERMKVWVAENRERHNKHGRDRRCREVNAKGSYEFEQWLKLVGFFNGICPACDKPMPKPTLDHIIPLVLGGTNNLDNLQPLCKRCNSSKGIIAIDYRPSLARAWASVESVAWVGDGL